MKKALITGITGQDGSYLAELLLEKGYRVYGLIRRNSSIVRERIDHLHQEYVGKKSQIELLYGDLGDASSLRNIISKVEPDEVYNLAAQSHVRVSFDIPEYTVDVTGTGTIRLLDAIRDVNPSIRFYQASSSEMYGLVQAVPQDEKTPFYPRSPYACAKLMSYWLTVNYRESYDMFACNGILFNHESPRRGENFVTRKITLGAAKTALGMMQCLHLGNLDAKRDWGFAGDYVEAMYLMLQQESPDDYVVATNDTHTVREFCEVAYERAGIQLEWSGSGVDEVGKVGKLLHKGDANNLQEGDVIIRIDPKFFRPAEVELLIGDYTKAERQMGWKPKTSFRELAEMMVDADLLSLKEEKKV